MESNGATERIPEDIINLVIARLETIPPNISISIGVDKEEGGGSLTIQQLIERVREQDPVGRKMVEVQLAYIQSLTGVTTTA